MWIQVHFSPRLYLFSLLLPLYSLTTNTAWPVILNRILAFPPRCPVSVLGKCWSGGRTESRKGGAGALEGEDKGQDAVPGCAGHSPNHPLLQVTTGRMKVRATPRSTGTPYPGTHSPGTETCPPGRRGAFLESCLPAPLPHYTHTHTDTTCIHRHTLWGLHVWLLDPALIIKSHTS